MALVFGFTGQNFNSVKERPYSRVTPGQVVQEVQDWLSTLPEEELSFLVLSTSGGTRALAVRG